MLKEKIQTPIIVALIGVIVVISSLGIALSIYYSGLVSAGSQAASANIYYVDATNGSDSNTGLSGSPLKSITKAVSQAVAGDTILVNPGTYYAEPSSNLKVNIAKSGVSGQMITIKAAGSGVKTYGFVLSNASYIRIEGFEVAIPLTSTWDKYSDGSGISLVGASYNEIINNTVNNSIREGIMVDTNSNNNKISGNTIKYAGTRAGIVLYGTGNLVQSNDISHSVQNPLIASGIKSTVSGADADGIKIYGSNQNISKNTIHDITFTDAGNQNGDSSPHIDGIQIIGPAANITIESNKIELPCDTSPISNTPFVQQVSMLQNNQGSVTNLVYRNNLLSACRGLNISKTNATNSMDTIKAYNNTFYNINDRGIINNGASNVAVKNNIFYNVGYNINNQSVKGAYFAGSASISNSNNDQYFPNLSQQPTLALGANDQQVDPKLSAVSTGNYHLVAASPLINQGLTLTEVTNDFDGVSRPQGSGYDIGAYEYAGIACTESWTCGDWTACVSNSQTRTCTDTNNCGTVVNKPATSQSCCSPVCTGKVCGDDGCGGSCGSCQTNQACTSGQCVASCTAQTCSQLGKTCGAQSDGCGGTLNCGTCTAAQNCTNGACVTKTCTDSACCKAKNSSYPYYKSSSKKCCRSSSIFASCIAP